MGRRTGVLLAVALSLIGLLALPAGAQAASTSFECIRPYNTSDPLLGGSGWSCTMPATGYPAYKGWIRSINQIMVTGNCGPTFTCGTATAPAAWRYTASGWQRHELSLQLLTTSYWNRTPTFYHHPLAAGWSWVWHASTGWLAMESRHITILVAPELWKTASAPVCTRDKDDPNRITLDFRVLYDRCRYSATY